MESVIPLSAVAIIEVGIGNTASLDSAFRKAGIQSVVVRDPDSLDSSFSRIVLPGVGNFEAFGRSLRQAGFWQKVTDLASDGSSSLLGVCVGAQIFFTGSEECSSAKGLGLVDGVVRKISTIESKTIPRVGWDYLDYSPRNNRVEDPSPSGSLDPRYFFSHSFCMSPSDESSVVASPRSAPSIPAIVRQRNLVAVQFHPERSGKFGQRFLQRFAEGAFDAA